MNAVLGVMFVAIFICLGAALWCFGSILFEHHINLNRRHKSQHQRKPEQTPCEANQNPRLSLHLGGRLRLVLRNKCLKFCRQAKLYRNLPLVSILLHPRKYFSDSRLHSAAKTHNAELRGARDDD